MKVTKSEATALFCKVETYKSDEHHALVGGNPQTNNVQSSTEGKKKKEASERELVSICNEP